jgi:tetratricopeptide (TPR) repeat protein
LEILTELVEIFSKTESQDLRWRILFSLVNAYTFLGDHQNAEETLKFLSDDRTRDLPPAYVSSYSLVMGNYHLVFGDFNTGMDFISNAMEICEKEWNRKKLATASNLMAQFLMHSREFEKGTEYAKKSLKISKESRDRYLETLNLIVLANLSRYLKQTNEIAHYASDALSKSVPLARPELTWQAHYCMGLAFHKKEEKKKAFRQYYNAIKLLDEMVNKIPDESLQHGYIAVPHRLLLFEDFANLVKSSDKKSEIDNVLKELRSAAMYETLTGKLSG